MTPASWLQRHPLLGYFVLTFGISWGGILIVLAASGFELSPMQHSEAGLIFVAMLLGPSLSGLIMTALLEWRAGTGGIRALGRKFGRLFRLLVNGRFRPMVDLQISTRFFSASFIASKPRLIFSNDEAGINATSKPLKFSP
ncbi:MAG TPA: hypothetical protein VMN38_07365 [Sphingomicrobium sp.]|nr:hypothetical protein [Sphingomicrobium sp.]